MIPGTAFATAGGKLDFDRWNFQRQEAAMYQVSYAVERALAVIDRGRRQPTEFGGAYRRPKRPSSGGFIPPVGDQELLTIVLLLVIAILSALDLMFACPDLGAVIAEYNQF